MSRLPLFALILSGLFIGTAAVAATESRPPNIVFFLCDDLGVGDVGALGGKDIQTPNIDALFARGTRLSWHWAGNAVCAPSRCVLMTGKHPGHAAVRSNREVKPEGQFPMPAGTVTLARILHDAGYATGGFGKWGLGAPGSVSDPVASGFDRFYGYNCQREAHTFYPGHLWDNRDRVPLDNRALSGEPEVARGGTVPVEAAGDEAAFAKFSGKQYSVDLIAREQLAFIREHADRPFFLYLPTTVPHLALQVPADEPSLADYERHFGAEEPYLGGRGYVPCRRPLATYAAMITRMDREVGRIVGLLAELGLADETIFVFSSDNGATAPGTGGIDTGRLKSNGDLRQWKGSPYEGGLRVPTAIVWPGKIPAGKTLSTPTGFEDWMPTLLDLAGLHDKIPAGCDGVSLAATLEGKAAAPADRFLYRELTEGKWQAVTDGRWKAVRRAAGPKQPERARPTELFDLSMDPSETTDVAAGHPDVVARLEALMDREHVPHPDWPLPFAAAASRRAGAAAERPAAALPAATATRFSSTTASPTRMIPARAHPNCSPSTGPRITPTSPASPPLPANWLPKHPVDSTEMDIRDEKAVSGVWRWRDEATIRNELVRRGDWKLIKYESPAGGLVTQLFNLRENPTEFVAEHHDPAVTAVSHASPAAHQKNLAADPAHADKQRELEALLLAEMQRLHDPYRFSDQTSGPAPP